MALTAVPLLFVYRSLSVTPRIHHRLPCDIRHRYRRYRPGDLHRAGGRGGPGYGGHGELAAGDFVDDAFDISNHSFPLYIVGNIRHWCLQPLSVVYDGEVVLFV